VGAVVFLFAVRWINKGDFIIKISMMTLKVAMHVILGTVPTYICLIRCLLNY